MRPIVARRPPMSDLILAGFYALVIVGEAFTEPQLANPWVHAVFGGVAMMSLVWRRQQPVLVAVVVVLALFPLAANGGGLSIVFGLIVMAFTVGSELDGRRAWLGLVLLALPFVLAVTIETGGLAGPATSVPHHDHRGPLGWRIPLAMWTGEAASRQPLLPTAAAPQQV